MCGVVGDESFNDSTQQQLERYLFIVDCVKFFSLNCLSTEQPSNKTSSRASQGPEHIGEPPSRLHFFFRLAFSLWIMMVIMVALIPQYFSRTLIAVGSNLWLANLVYILSVPPKSLVIPFPGSSGQTVNLTCSFCSCFWIILGSGMYTC